MSEKRDEAKSTLATVKSAILTGCAVGRLGIGDIADDCGLTIRTLQRRLAQQQTTFSDVREQLICAEAERLLEQSEYRIEEIALRVGYTDPSHFSRAFRRWTGSSPRQYRNHRKS